MVRPILWDALSDRSAGLAQYEFFFEKMGLGRSLKTIIREKIKKKGVCRVLDVGCGTGRALKDLKRLFKTAIYTVGVDAVASRDARQNCDTFIAANMLTGDFFSPKEAGFSGDSGGYDIIISFRALHLVGHSETILAKIAGALARGGDAFISIRCQEWGKKKAKFLGAMCQKDVLFLLDVLEKGVFQGCRVKGAHSPVVLDGVVKDQKTGEPEKGVKAYIAGVTVWFKKPPLVVM